MSKKVKKSQNNKSFKIIIILLALSMLGSLFYISKLSSKSKRTIIELREEKANMLNDLEKSQLFLKQVITSNKSLSGKLLSEQNKVQQLIINLQKKEVTEKTIIDYKQSTSDIDNRIKSLLNEIDSYKDKIDSTNLVLNKTNVVLIKEKIKNDTLVVSNKKLTKKITDATKLYFYNLQTVFLKLKSSGKQTETDKASRVNLIKISFMIAENDLSKSTTKDFYVQIIDSKSNVLGDKNIQKFGDDILTYSALLKVKYENKTIKVEGEIPVTNLNEGVLFINVFDKSKLILKSTVTLS
ncbi:MAG: hypothetical protein ABI549_02605 [Flavobacterium sp.]|uniref:hypothetical protein n=1 Tax=Flavobacterium sp. TaxID=239 RepID=UPI0032645556